MATHSHLQRVPEEGPDDSSEAKADRSRFRRGRGPLVSLSPRAQISFKAQPAEPPEVGKEPARGKAWRAGVGFQVGGGTRLALSASQP